MPNAWTHIIYGEKLMGRQQRFQDKISTCETLFRFGTQGPDFLFYHRFWPWYQQKEGPLLGDKMHHQHCGSFLLDMIDYVKEQGCPPELVAYVSGFISHHLLDRTTHPYIIYHSGSGKPHSKCEIIIDTLLIKKWKGKDAWRHPVYPQIHVGPSLPASVVQLYQKLLPRYYPDHAEGISGNLIKDSYRDMIRALRFLYDPSGIKNKFLSSMMSWYSYQKKIPEGIDFLNESKKVWRHPVLDTESRESFLELFQQAVEEGSEVMDSLFKYWYGDDRDDPDQLRSKLKSQIGNMNYDFGLDCSKTWVIKHVQFFPSFESSQS